MIPNTDATQRVKIDSSGTPQTPAASRKATPAEVAQRRRNDAEKAKKRRKEQTALIILCSVILLLLIAVIVAVIFLFGGTKDNGLILNNVYAAGVNLGNMTPEQAKERLESIADEYAELSMSVQVLDTTVELSPSKTGARLDIDAVVDAAYDYGRTGSRSEQQKAKDQAATTSHTISIIPFLNLNEEYISQVVAQIGNQYSSLRTDPVVTITGSEAPETQEIYDTTMVFQTMAIKLGTAQYGLSTNDLYEQILDAYNSRLFQVVGECSVDPPESPEIQIQNIYNQYCRAPIDAQIDGNYNVTPEVYGYGFTMEAVMEQVSAAAYGATITVPMTYIEPDITAEKLAGDLFQDILGSCVIDTGDTSAELAANMKLVLDLLNNKVLKAGETFSFNDLVGELTVQRGYKKVYDFNGAKWEEKVGGGVSKISSALYYCALLGDLEILERHSHIYAPTYMALGTDADIAFGTKDLRFRNNTPDPIRIIAEFNDGKLELTMLGTDVKTYTVEIFHVVESTTEGKTLYQSMDANNAGGLVDGQVLQEAITGYTINVYMKCTYESDAAGSEPGNTSDTLIGKTYYAKRNALVVKINTPMIPDPNPIPPFDSIPSN